MSQICRFLLGYKTGDLIKKVSKIKRFQNSIRTQPLCFLVHSTFLQLHGRDKYLTLSISCRYFKFPASHYRKDRRCKLGKQGIGFYQADDRHDMNFSGISRITRSLANHSRTKCKHTPEMI